MYDRKTAQRFDTVNHIKRPLSPVQTLHKDRKHQFGALGIKGLNKARLKFLPCRVRTSE